ncbi:gastrula zinc finger protein XlCGF57.1-like [Achroia grisella]|uniref:gastrula zinc finger protein XlCGF57.1-like n=1 Tax=Achroia grisella TaxID=688607 RepID=UPI0027D2EA3A|nr:gastrula zinc finger protein XlCGF57.1-like [Achroia grisella]
MLEIDKYCRTCMKYNTSLMDLFQPLHYDNIAPVHNVLMECTGMQVSKDDGLPQKICDDCLKMIKSMYSFREQALLAEAKLKKIISIQNVKGEEIKTEVKSEVVDDFDANLDSFLLDSDFPKEEVEDYHQHNNVADVCSEIDLPKNEYTDDTFDGDFALSENNFNLEQYSTSRESDSSKKSRKKFSCSICNKQYNKISSLNKHLTKHKPLNKLRCNICDKDFETETLLVEHTLSHSEELTIKTDTNEDKIYKCPNCDLKYSKRRSLSMHLKRHKGENSHSNKKRYVCDMCHKDFAMKSLLKRHMQLHSKEKVVKCTICSKSYYRQDQFLEHMKKHNGIKPHVCSYCNKGFTQLCSLKDHERTHTGETPYLCSQCGKGFANSSNLRQHMMRHTGLKPFSCKLCPKTFCTKGQVTSHMTTHTGAHPHSCEECGARFTTNTSLKKHKLIHLGIKPYSCDTCKQSFSCKDHLKRHYRIHTGEKPYKCIYCERAFTQSNDLVKHKRTHEGQNLYRCTICGMRFRLATELKQHYPVHYVEGDVTIPIGKGIEAPVLILKPEEMAQTTETSVNEIDPRITITINSGLDKNGLAGDITIDISPEKS